MEALLWTKAPDGKIKCQVCAHSCLISENKAGICGVRVNHGGKLLTLTGDVTTALQIDPIEKKPLYHFLPNSKIFSVGSAGCNFHCRFCQNHEIAHVDANARVRGRRLNAETLVRLSEENRVPAIAFTYNEPTVFVEQVYNTAGIAKAHGLKTVLVSNGFMSPEFLQTLGPRIDAANIDLKSFSDDFYKHYCQGRLAPVLDNLRIIKKMGWWLEVTTLLIPGINDSSEEIAKIAAFIRDDLGKNTPWHISAFHGAHEMRKHPATPVETLERAWQLGRDSGLEFVYTGNIPGAVGENTICPDCGTTLIQRYGYQTRVKFKNAQCPKCGRQIPGVWN